MNRSLQERTSRLLADYILFCALEPGTPEPPPTSVEAALLRSLSKEIQQKHQVLFSSFRDHQSNRVELVRQMADMLLSSDQNISWGRLAMLLVFAGTLVTRGTSRTVKQRSDLRNRFLLEQDCYRIMSLLYSLLMGPHRSWLRAHGGWISDLVRRSFLGERFLAEDQGLLIKTKDGFCRFFKSPLPLAFWRRLLIRTFLSCFFATAIFYVWKQKF